VDPATGRIAIHSNAFLRQAVYNCAALAATRTTANEDHDNTYPIHKLS
jgi:hypothetical protein